MHYTYVLESVKRPGIRYIGHTSDLIRRLHQHNVGGARATAQHRPWKAKLYIAAKTRDLARGVEHYLKSGSGHAFAKRHFWNLES